jgi:integrase
MSRLVLPHFGSHQIESVRPSDIQRWVTRLGADGYAASTVRKAHQLLSGAFGVAVNDEALPQSPCRGIRLPKEDERDLRFLDTAEIHSLADASGPRYQALVLTAAFTGLRFGELAALRLEDLNLLRRTLTVSKTLSEVGGLVELTEPKTKAARRSVALPQTVARVIGSHIEAHSSERGIVFPSPAGDYLRRTNFRLRHWLPAVRKSVGEPCRFHDLRHSHVSLLIQAGEHPKTIAARLGHKSVRTVLDVYGHIYEGMDEAAADRLEDVISHHLAASVRPGA